MPRVRHIEDPLQGDFPEVIEEYKEHGCMKCIAFNRRGTLLADDAGGRLNRKRKPSEKLLELQTEKVNKPSKSGKLAKSKSKSLVDQDNGNGFYGDVPYDD